MIGGGSVGGSSGGDASGGERGQRLYERARALPTDERAAFVEEACRGDRELHDEILSLLERSEEAEAFFHALGETLVSASFPPELADGAASVAGAEQEGEPPAPPSPPEDLPAGHEIGHYRILERVARGGMGTVYRARDLKLGRDVALKFLPPHVVAEAADRLLLEASAAAALEHPNVCTVYEIGETPEGRPYLAMAFYEGETLAVRLRRGPLAPAEAWHVAVAMARGLAAAHGRGIVHGDVKPGNVMLTAAGEVKLLDFGLARMGDATLMRPGATFGTIAYMSPEQVRGEALDGRSDLWSLGVVLYEMLTGARPFRGADGAAVLHAILHADPKSVREARPGIPEALAHVVERLLRKEREARYRAAPELLADLERAGHGRLEAARSSRPGRRPRRAALRRPAVLSGAVVGLLLVVAAIAAWPLGSGGEPRTDPRPMPAVAAHELYMRANDPALLRSDSGVRRGVEYMEHAVAADSTYAEAHAGLARMYLALGGRDDPGLPVDELHERAERAARKALALDDSLAEAHAVLGLIRQYAAFDFERAEAGLKRSIALDPTRALPRQWLVQVYLQTGRAAEALKEARGALDVDPLSPNVLAEVAHALLADGRPDEALTHLERIAAVRPPLLRAPAYTAQAYAMKGMWPEAIAAIRPQVEAGQPRALGLYGHLLARGGQRDEALGILETLLERWQRGEGGAFDVALVHAGLGDLDQAFAWLDRAADERPASHPTYYVMMPILEDLRADPRFARLRERLGLRDR